jgi:hypothetical protein
MSGHIPRTDLSSVGRAWAIGMDLVVYVIAGGVLGWGLDLLFKTGPLLMVIFGLLGLASGMLRFIREALVLNRETTRRAMRGRAGGAGGAAKNGDGAANQVDGAARPVDGAARPVDSAANKVDGAARGVDGTTH